jgi:hypothetical protein
MMKNVTAYDAIGSLYIAGKEVTIHWKHNKRYR